MDDDIVRREQFEPLAARREDAVGVSMFSGSGFTTRAIAVGNVTKAEWIVSTIGVDLEAVR